MNFLIDISTEMIAGTIIFILGFIGAKLPHSVDKYKLRKFFGDALFKNDCSIVYGMLTKIPDENIELKKPLYEKKYHDGKGWKVPLFSTVTSDGLFQSHSYIVQSLASFRKKSFVILTDKEALKNLNSTFICLGGSIINELTQWAINEKSNEFLKFSIPKILYETPITIDVISDSTNKLSFKSSAEKDYGMILKIKNSRFPKHYFFVCAGIRTTGSISAAWYLSEKWKNLQNEFGNKEFGIVLEVNKGIITSATRVYP